MKKQNFVFFDTGSGDESEVLYVTEGVGVMVVQVSGTTGYSLTVKAKTDFETDEWVSVGGISIADMSMVDTITDNGIYYFPMLACNSAKMLNSGTTGGVKVHAWLVE